VKTPPRAPHQDPRSCCGRGGDRPCPEIRGATKEHRSGSWASSTMHRPAGSAPPLLGLGRRHPVARSRLEWGCTRRTDLAAWTAAIHRGHGHGKRPVDQVHTSNPNPQHTLSLIGGRVDRACRGRWLHMRLV
jgi:hypothetical protein